MSLSSFSLSAHGLVADVRTEQKTQVQFSGMLGRMMNMFGGKAARDGITSTVAVKGDWKATFNDATSQIIDLNEEKVYDLDLKRRSYKVTTFAEMRRQMEEAQRKAAENASRDEGKPSESTATDKQVEVDFEVKNTGATKTINGFDTRQSVMTITVREKGKTLEQAGGMVLTADMWLTPRVASMQEIADFDARYAKKLYGGLMAGVSADQMAAAVALYPMMSDALGKMSSEASKIEGTAITTVMTLEAVKSGDQPAAGEQAQAEARPSRGLSGMLGGLAKRVKKGDEEPKARTTFMTSTTEVLTVASEVAPTDLAIPAGFKESK